MTYTDAAVLGVVLAVVLDQTVGTKLLRRKAFWCAYGIVLFFQLIVNGLLTGLRIVRYDPSQILGPRVAFAPVEDLMFGFTLVLVTLICWVWLGRAFTARGERPVRRAGHRARRPPDG